MAENKNKNLDKDMNEKQNQGSDIGSPGRSGDLDRDKGSMGHENKRKPSPGGFSGSTGSISGDRQSGVTGESDIEGEAGVERGELERDVEP
ncbi:MAG TPA: hypothetical protein VIL97_09365 [Thermoanaerobaculia bacterium]